ncbi:MAG: ankyrin repeat domain-containing protein [Proteobacteria bacterium]|nr:ankyrin repeat domain-containing protein [Pseudomonadota bacterium]
MLSGISDFLSKSITYITHAANYWFGLSNHKLFAAAKTGNTQAVKQLLSKGTFIDSKTNIGNTALHIASESGCIGVVECLLDNKAMVNFVNHQKNTPLHLAGASGNTEIAMRLINQGASLNVVNLQGNNPLHMAALHGNIDTLSHLMARFGKLDNSQYNQLLEKAVVAEKLETVFWLINNYPNKNNIDFFQLLVTCIKDKRYQSLHMLLGYSSYLTRSHLDCLVNIAIFNGDIQSVHTLVNFGANVNNPAKPILEAVKQGDVALFNSLVAVGANMYVTDKDGNNVFHLAVQESNYSMLKALTNVGLINTREKNYMGQSPISMVEDRIKQMELKLTYHQHNYKFQLDHTTKQHHLETQKMLPRFPDHRKDAVIYRRNLMLTEELAKLNQLTQEKEFELNKNIAQLKEIKGMLLNIASKFNTSKRKQPAPVSMSMPINLYLPEPSAPPFDDKIVSKPRPMPINLYLPEPSAPPFDDKIVSKPRPMPVNLYLPEPSAPPLDDMIVSKPRPMPVNLYLPEPSAPPLDDIIAPLNPSYTPATVVTAQHRLSTAAYAKDKLAADEVTFKPPTKRKSTNIFKVPFMKL